MPASAQVPVAPVFAVMAFGVLVAIAGHVARARWLVATGLALLFLATAGMLVGGYLSYHDGGVDLRPIHDPREPTF
jgi:hypothetical protein